MTTLANGCQEAFEIKKIFESHVFDLNAQTHGFDIFLGKNTYADKALEVAIIFTNGPPTRGFRNLGNLAEAARIEDRDGSIAIGDQKVVGVFTTRNKKIIKEQMF